MNYAIMRFTKLKTIGSVAGVAGHHTRDHVTPNADPAQSNRWLVGPPRHHADDLVDAVRRRVEGTGKRIRKNGVLAFEFLLAASPQFFRPDDPARAGHYDLAKADAFAETAVAWLRREFGAENLISAVLHTDESTPHVQAIIVPVDPDTGHLNASRWTDGRAKLSGLQDSFAGACWPLGLERGVKGSRATHERVKAFYEAVNSAESPSVGAEVQVPPLLVREAARDAWAAEESERINAQIRPSMQAVADEAASARLARSKQRTAEATAHAAQVELERMRQEAKLVRDIPLNVVLEKAGYKEFQAGIWMGSAGRIELAVHEDGRVKFWCSDIGTSGRNGIDLAMCINGFSCAEAVAWLAAKVGRSEAISAAMHQARQDAQDAVRSRPPTPRPPKPRTPECQPSHLLVPDSVPDHGPELRAR